MDGVGGDGKTGRDRIDVVASADQGAHAEGLLRHALDIVHALGGFRVGLEDAERTAGGVQVSALAPAERSEALTLGTRLVADGISLLHAVRARSRRQHVLELPQLTLGPADLRLAVIVRQQDLHYPRDLILVSQEVS